MTTSLCERTCAKYGLVVVQRCTPGHASPDVFHVRDRHGTDLVLKLGDTPKTVGEVIKNERGYGHLRSLRLEDFVPRVHICEVKADEAIMLMEHCGEDLMTQLRGSPDPAAVYETLVHQMKTVYDRSRRATPEAPATLEPAVQQVLRQYELHLRTPLDPNGSLGAQLAVGQRRIREAGKTLHATCFASWDFTPRNVCLSTGTVKYIDPNEEVIGVPLVDLACFAGVSRDVASLPGSDTGYVSLRHLALEVGASLGIPHAEGARIFGWGRVLQCLLGARFRLNTEPDQARAFFQLATKHLEEEVLA